MHTLSLETLRSPLTGADLATCCRMDDLGIMPFEEAEYYASLRPQALDWLEAKETLARAETAALWPSGWPYGSRAARLASFCAGFVEEGAPGWEKCLLLVVMAVSVPLAVWGVGAWLLGVMEGRL